MAPTTSESDPLGLKRPYSVLRVSVFRTLGLEPRQHIDVNECTHIDHRVHRAMHLDTFNRLYNQLRPTVSGDHPLVHFPAQEVANYATVIWEWLRQGTE